VAGCAPRGVRRTVVARGGKHLREHDREDDLPGGGRVRTGAGAHAESDQEDVHRHRLGLHPRNLVASWSRAKSVDFRTSRIPMRGIRFPPMRIKNFLRHYVEMVVAMMLGMFVLGFALAALLGAGGIDVGDWRSDAPELLLLGMAFTMSAPMVAWMRYRGHGWAPAGEMTAAMFVPSLAAIALYWGGIMEDGHALLMIQHVAMFPAMLAVMLLRLDEYTGHVHAVPTHGNGRAAFE
jgi:hypothetical protein